MADSGNTVKKDKLIVICDGKEISYGMALIHMLKYENDNECIKSSAGENYDAEMHSFVAYKHSSVGKNTMKIFVGNASSTDPSEKSSFAKYGMTICQKSTDYIFTVDETALKNKTYDEFIEYANKKREEFILLEKAYVEKIATLDRKWLPGPFALIQSTGMFRRGNKQKIQQLYDCMAYVFYLDFLAKK